MSGLFERIGQAALKTVRAWATQRPFVAWNKLTCSSSLRLLQLPCPPCLTCCGIEWLTAKTNR